MAKIAVAPLVGAWIEILLHENGAKVVRVAPLVGAWIEIPYVSYLQSYVLRRSPRGSVD